MTPRLSIVIPSHNRADLLAACLGSIARHAQPGIEVLVVDDGSSDAVVSRTASEYPGTRILRQESSQGFCVTANRGIESARAPIVQLLNDDTEVHAGWAEAGLRPFANPQVAAVSPLVILASSPSTIDSAGDGYFIGGVAYKRHHGSSLERITPRAQAILSANGTASFFRRDAYLSVGGMPEEFGAYFDDVDLSFRLHHAGYRIRFEPGSRVSHHGSSSYGRPSGELLALQSRNEELVFWRNVQGCELLFALPLHVAVLAGKAALRLSEGNLGPALRGRLAALFALPGIFRQRWAQQGRQLAASSEAI